MAARLAGSAHLTAALGAGASPVEDRGGLTETGSFVSYAFVMTPKSALDVFLSTYPSVREADDAYQQGLALPASPPPQPLTGIGDKAEVVGTDVAVLKGAQVLVVKGQLSRAAGERLVFDKSPALRDAANAETAVEAQTAASALGRGMQGDAAKDPLAYLPAGAVDPCTVPASTLTKGDIHVTSHAQVSDLPPALECVYSFTGTMQGQPGTGQLAVYTLTDAQARSAAQPTTAAAALASVGMGSRKPPLMNTFGPLQTSSNTAGEPDYAVLVNLPAAAPPTVSALLVRVRDQHSSYVVDELHCADEIITMMNDMLKSANENGQSLDAIIGNDRAQAALDKIRNDILTWCQYEAQGH